jgi:3D (Asp-Asp-Asp) domain-containing protein
VDHRITNEAVNHDSWARFEFCLSAVRQRACGARACHGLPGEGSGKSAAWNGARLGEDHCAVDPKKIPYGSKVIFGDSECTAIDTGPDVVKRKAARSLGHTTAERNAIVVDRFFESRQTALAWESTHPHFMMVRIRAAQEAAN